MATLYGDQMTKVTNLVVSQRPAISDVSAPVRVFLETITLASQTTSDIIYCGRIPLGARVLRISLNTSVTLGSSTLALGISGSTGKYRAAAVLTAANAWEVNALNAATGVALTAQEDIYFTIGAATLPASGRLLVLTEYTFN
jgi:hypothetical protein